MKKSTEGIENTEQPRSEEKPKFGCIKMVVRRILDEDTGRILVEHHVDNSYLRCYAEPLPETFTKQVKKILPLVGETVWVHSTGSDQIRWMPMVRSIDVASILRGTVSYQDAPEFFDSFFETDEERWARIKENPHPHCGPDKVIFELMKTKEKKEDIK